MNYATLGRRFTLKFLTRLAFAPLSLISTGIAHSQPATYQAPSHNYYQNNWLAGGGG